MTSDLGDEWSAGGRSRRLAAGAGEVGHAQQGRVARAAQDVTPSVRREHAHLIGVVTARRGRRHGHADRERVELSDAVSAVLDPSPAGVARLAETVATVETVTQRV